MFVPKAHAGRVVGQKGAVISQMQSDTGAKSISAQKSTETEGLWISVTILGSPDKVLSAYMAVSALVDGEVDEVVLEFQLHRKLHSNAFNLRTGKMHARHMYEISAESNCRVQVPEQFPGNLQQQHQANVFVVLEGTIDNTFKCMELILNKRPPQVQQSAFGGLDEGPGLSGLRGLGFGGLGGGLAPAAAAQKNGRQQQQQPQQQQQQQQQQRGGKQQGSSGSLAGLGASPHNPFLFGLDDVAMVNSLTADGRDDGGLGLGKAGLEHSLSFPPASSPFSPSAGAGAAAAPKPPAPVLPKENFKERLNVTPAQLSILEAKHPMSSPGSETKEVSLFPFLLKIFSSSNTRITPNINALRKTLTRTSSASAPAATKPTTSEGDEGAGNARRRRVTDEDEDEDDGEDEDDDEEGEDEEEGQDGAVAPASVEPTTDAPPSAPLTATITVTAHSAVEAKMCADTLRSVLDGTALQAAVDALPSRKEIKLLVHKERAEREETLGANLSTEDRINALRQQGAGGGGGGGAGSGKARGSRGGSRRGPPP